MARERTSERVRGFGTTIFAEMSALAREHNAVNLGQGFPDFDGPESVKAAVQAALAAGRNQYAVSHGEAALRKAISDHAARFYGQQIDPDCEITVTSGATEAIWCAAFAFIEPGDEVIVFEPTYDSYVPTIRMAGGIPVPVMLASDGFRFDPDELRRAFTPRTRVLYLNTPHNPTGTVFNHDELSLIADLCREHDVLAIVDEVYEHIIYDGAVHRRLATYPGMWERTLTVSSAGKTFSFTGWKVGWAMGPAELQGALRKIHQFTVFATATPLQYAMAEALGLPDEYYRTLSSEYQAARDHLAAVLDDVGLRNIRPRGSYFILADIGNFPQKNGVEFCRYLVREVGVAAIPMSGFYLNPTDGDRLVRFCFCKSHATLDAAAERLQQVRAVLQ